MKTISDGLIKARIGDTVVVKPGVYKESITLTSGVVLLSQELFKATITGKGRGDIVTISHNSTISGFQISKGNVGILSRGPGNTILKCKIFQNRGTGIICIGTMAHIENNTIVYNGASGIQVLDITSGAKSISHNTIAYNGNHGIIYSGTSVLSIENNIIANNSAFGIKVQKINRKLINTHNCFFANHHIKFIIPEDNFTFDPMFIAPKRKTLDFALQKESKAIKRGNDNKNLGSLFVQ